LRNRRKWEVAEIVKPPQAFARALDSTTDEAHGAA
jgi:hypothetical protein